MPAAQNLCSFFSTCAYLFCPNRQAIACCFIILIILFVCEKDYEIVRHHGFTPTFYRYIETPTIKSCFFYLATRKSSII